MAGQDTNKLVIIKKEERTTTYFIYCRWWVLVVLVPLSSCSSFSSRLPPGRSSEKHSKLSQSRAKVVPKLSQSCPKVVPKSSQSCPNVVILLAVVTTIIKYSWKQSKQNFCCILIHKHRSGAVTTRCKPPSFLAGEKKTLFQGDSVNVFSFSWRNMMA